MLTISVCRSELVSGPHSRTYSARVFIFMHNSTTKSLKDFDELKLKLGKIFILTKRGLRPFFALLQSYGAAADSFNF